MKRREFIEWMGHGAVTLSLLPYTACTGNQPSLKPLTLQPIQPSKSDSLKLAEGLSFDILTMWEDEISQKDQFGFNNDFTCFIPLDGKVDEGILWVNHEYVDSCFIHGGSSPKNLEQVKMEQYNVGGSLIHIRCKDNKWSLIYDSPYNRRITAETMIPLNWDEPIAGSSTAKGTLGNCAGGLTPWGTILTCEENYQDFYGERLHNEDHISSSDNGWEKLDPQPPEHFGWVVEVNPLTGEAQKHIALGRCAHECATVVSLPDGRIAVYTGDDKNDEHLYKFISSSPNSLKEGKLYVASLEKSQWISLDIDDQPILAENFKNQTEVQVYLRKAAKLVGGTALDRPEDIEIDPINGHVLVTLTNNVPKGNYHGSILKIIEDENKHDALAFESSAFLTGGEELGFAAPDNMIFDRQGNLWFTSDISGSKMNKPPYESFMNNGLFIVPRKGPQAGQVLQMASAPTDAEFTGPWFSPDGKTLFLSVQHPGDQSSKVGRLTSNWPKGDDQIPRSSVVTLQGPLLNEIQGIE